jgi:hypothetical protein
MERIDINHPLPSRQIEIKLCRYAGRLYKVPMKDSDVKAFMFRIVSAGGGR